jgi:hypothetical protein
MDGWQPRRGSATRRSSYLARLEHRTVPVRSAGTGSAAAGGGASQLVRMRAARMTPRAGHGPG